MRTSIAALLLAIALIASFAVAQQPYFESLDVTLHNLDVLVTDAKGNPVRGLAKEDFILHEEGVEQTITNFAAYESGTTHSSAVGESGEPQETRVRESAPPRRVVFFVDDMSIRKPVRNTLIKNANLMLDQLQPGDLAAVARPIGKERMPQPFTGDLVAARKVLAREIESCKVRFTSLDDYNRAIENARKGLDGGNDLDARELANSKLLDERFAQGSYVDRENERMRHRLGQLRAIIASMAGIEGRKLLVILTDGLPAIPGRLGTSAFDQMYLGIDRPVTEWNQGGDFTPLIDELGRLAAANGVTIYSIEPQIPLEKALIGDSASSGAQRPTNADRVSGTTSMRNDRQRVAQPLVSRDLFGEMQHNRAQTLRSLAEKTGGDWTRGVPMIDNLFRQISSELSVYYSLAYRATGAVGKARRVQVRVRNRPDLKVRTRSEVIERAPDREMEDLVASTLLFPRDVNELHMNIETGKPLRGKRTVYVPVEVVVPLETLTFLSSGEGKYSASVDIHFATSGFENPSFSSGHQRQTFEISETQHANRTGMNYRFKSGVEVYPGRTRIAIGAMDPVSHLVGFRTTEIEAR